MPKGGRNRQSDRDEARRSDLAGGLGGDEDYDWIKYLGEGRSSPGASSSQASSRSSEPAGAAARPAPLPQRVKQAGDQQGYDGPAGDWEPVGRELPGQAPVGRGRAADPYDDDRRGREFGRHGARTGRSERPGGPGGPERPVRGRREGRRRRSGRSDWPEQQIGYADQRPLAAESELPSDGRRDRAAGSGRAVTARPDRAPDSLFNPAAEDYRQPLYPPADGQLPGGPRQDRPAGAGREGQWRLDTAEYVRPLYPFHDAGPATDSRPPRSWPGEDPLGDTDAGTRRVPADRRPSLPPGRPARGGSPGREPVSPQPQDLTSPPRRRGGSPVRPGPDDLTSPSGRRGERSALPRRADRTGPQRALSDPDLAEGARGSSRIRVIAETARSPGATAGHAAPDLARDNVALAPDLQVTATTAPPRPAVKPGRKQRRASSSKQATSTPKPGKGRARAGEPASQRRSRRRVPVKARILLGVLLVAALGAGGYVFLLPKTSHVVSAPARAGGYVRQPADATADGLKQRIVKAAAGSAKNVVAAVYQLSSGPGTSKGPQIIVFIGGNLAGGASADSLISAYMARLSGAFTTSPGSLGGQAACAPGSNGGPAECAWADNDTFGVLVSATMNSASLAVQMVQMRPLLEHAAR
jgi:hypothetical protein